MDNSGVSFGALTMLSHNITFEKLDLNSDGFVTEDELKQVAKKEEVDVLDLSCIDKDADSKVTEDEYILWQQESEISRITEQMKSQIARDLVGKDADDIKKGVSMLDDYMKSYIENYTSMNNDISKMAKMYSAEIADKYKDIKTNVLKNTKSAIKDRVLEEMVKYVEKHSQGGVGQFGDLVYDKSAGLSDNAKRLLSNELGAEADKFIKNYSGNDLESDLTEHLKQFLNQTDKSKLADAISIWEKGKEELASLPRELALAEAKSKAKSFLQRAVKEGINSLKLGDVTVRNELEIMAALAQYKNYEDLQHDLNKAISQLSTISRMEELEASSQKDINTNFEQTNILSGNIFQAEPKAKNIFIR